MAGSFNQPGPELLLHSRVTEMNTTWSSRGEDQENTKVCQPERLQCNQGLHIIHRTSGRPSQRK